MEMAFGKVGNTFVRRHPEPGITSPGAKPMHAAASSEDA